MSERLIDILIDSFSKILIPGLKITLPLTAIAFTLAIIIAVICAMIQFAKVKGLRQIVRFYVWFVRGTPLLVQLFIIFYGLPKLGIIIDPLPCAILVFSINEGAYCTETMRGALESVPSGQMEAGYCCGMTYTQIMIRIVLPQAFRTAFPALGNSLISLLKDTSLASTITVAEMLVATKKIIGRTYEPLALYIEVALIYLMFTTILNILQSLVEKKLNSYGKRV